MPTSSSVENVFIAALRFEAETVTALLTDLGGEEWDTPTPATGWTVRHQVAHLISVYRLATQAANDPEGFRSLLAQLSGDFTRDVAASMQPLLAKSQVELTATWEHVAAEAVIALDSLPGDRMLPWLLNDIPVSVLAMAGTTEAFAHGQDIRDTFGTLRTPNDHVRAICEFAYHTREFGWLGRGAQPPAELDLRFELNSPRGQHWTIGNPEGDDVVSGDAWDLALLVTRRRHPDDLALSGGTELARRWMSIAQAYRGPAGDDRKPGQFASR
ncbi:maleylpyruvate isomerase family mycothiol-dependent enzyme [Nocardia sp. CNY236]|uniref:maleylpyruvate isomerase family mycothiol-dependent enzyme n=1 Tax=Nocardia sp. CNY236 TaxID=1169152 RepID=UPI00042A01A3|nr:maleylpyruvate isomerase family mycothiol-dependent enzyme [Nocardia sp. CNY236]